MKDEAKDEVVIVFMGSGVAAFLRKRARSRDMPRQTPSKKPGAGSGRACCTLSKDYALLHESRFVSIKFFRKFFRTHPRINSSGIRSSFDAARPL